MDKVREKIFSSEALILQHGGITEKIANSQIRYIESNAHQLLIHTISGEVALYEKLDVYEKKLHKDFLRVHKSFLVNEMKEVTLQDGTVLPVSKTRYSASRDKYFRYMRAML